MLCFGTLHGYTGVNLGDANRLAPDGRPWSSRGNIGNWAPAVVAVTVWLAVVGALDPAGDYPDRMSGPGLTIDEIFNVELGVLMVDRLLDVDLLGYAREAARLPDHPPLGRLWIGLCHEAALIADTPRHEHSAVVVACARTASATAFALLIYLVGTCAARWYGTAAGICAAVALPLMPRVFGHAHLAALETTLNLTWTASVLSLATWWSTADPPPRRTLVLTSLLFGLALLTKIQAIFIPLPLVVWAIIRWRQRALLPLAIWGGIGLLVFFLGWTWLWSDPIGNFSRYFANAAQRASIQVWYLGRAYADVSAPWHYPWVLFLTTIPVGLLILGAWGLRVGELPLWKSPRESFLAGCMFFPLIVFNLPGGAIYDGERLFLIVFPLWAIWVGRGAAAVLTTLRRRWSLRVSSGVLTIVFACQAVGIWSTAPCYLSYYNLLVGGLPGAVRLGLAPTYWGDSLTRDLLQQTAKLPPGTVVACSPVLHTFQLPALIGQSPQLRAQSIEVREYGAPGVHARYVLYFTRREYLPAGWTDGPPTGAVIAEVRRQGVCLAALYDLEAAPTTPPERTAPR